jgi:hypothetical protein
VEKRVVAVAITDPKRLYHAVELLKKLELEYAVCAPDDPRTQTANAVLTTRDETLYTSDTRAVFMDGDDESTSIDINLRLLSILHPSLAAIGVDPGMRFGLALVVDGRSVSGRTTDSPIAAANTVWRWAHFLNSRFPEARVVIRIGTGSRLFLLLCLRELRDKNSLMIELVDEHHTTRANGTGSDESSATIIASRAGHRPTGADYLLSAREGDLVCLKKLYAQLTNGKEQLSTDEALSIIEGDRQLSQFLKEAE